MLGAIRRFFKLDELGTTVGTEIRAGLVTFMALAYIIFVQPGMLAQAGMDFGAVMMATCLASALATILMGLLANYPIALAPAMGHNAFFVFVVCGMMKVPWQVALGANFISGMIFVLISFVGLREHLMDAVPPTLKNGIAVGIGMLIAIIGLQNAGIVVHQPATIVGLGNLKAPHVLLSLFGLAVVSLLMARRVPGAILISMLLTAAYGAALGFLEFPRQMVAPPPSLRPTLARLDIAGALQLRLVDVIFVFLFLDLFDTIGTLIGIGQQGGFMREGKLPRAREALFADAVGTVAGAFLGTSTITSYIESSAGVSEGGRSGLANMVTALLFIAAIFFSPVIAVIGGGYHDPVSGGHFNFVTAPVLIVIGSLMLSNIREIHFGDVTEAIPAFLAIILMPLTFSITEGIAFGFISYAFLKLVTGRGREVSWLVYLFSILFIVRYIVS